jgi:Flp pilus assembly CpaE family ATPase
VVDLPAGTAAGVLPAPGDLFLIVADPTRASLAVARGLAARARVAEMVVVGHRVEGPEDVRELRRSFPGYEIVLVPDDDSITEADRHGISPLELDSRSPAVRSVETLARRLGPRPAESVLQEA